MLRTSDIVGSCGTVVRVVSVQHAHGHSAVDYRQVERYGGGSRGDGRVEDDQTERAVAVEGEDLFVHELFASRVRMFEGGCPERLSGASASASSILSSSAFSDG